MTTTTTTMTNEEQRQQRQQRRLHHPVDPNHPRRIQISLIDIRSEFAESVIESTRHAKLRGKPFKLAHDRK